MYGSVCVSLDGGLMQDGLPPPSPWETNECCLTLFRRNHYLDGLYWLALMAEKPLHCPPLHCRSPRAKAWTAETSIYSEVLNTLSSSHLVFYTHLCVCVPVCDACVHACANFYLQSEEYGNCRPFILLSVCVSVRVRMCVCVCVCVGACVCVCVLQVCSLFSTL